VQIPFLDLKSQYESIRGEVNHRLQGVIEDCSFILGPEVERFEKAFASYCGVSYCIGVGSGLDALTLSIRALGVQPGDEIIIPANTFVATGLAIIQAGAQPVLVDCCENDFNIDPEKIEAAITPATKAIIPVHLYGRLANMKAVCDIANRHGLHVIEDAAQAHGAETGGNHAGGFGTAGCFSFFPGKNLGAYGDGGAVVTNDENLANKIKYLRNYGSKVKYEHEYLGVNSRLDSLQAAVLSVKLQYLDRWSELRRERASWYDKALQIEAITRPSLPSQKEHVWHLYVIRSNFRNELLSFLQQKGIMAQIHYPHPVHLHACFEGKLGGEGKYPVAEKLSREIISLPIYPELSKEQIDFIAETVKSFPQTVLKE